MTINVESAGPAPNQEDVQDAARPPRAANGRKAAIRLVTLASAVRLATDERTLCAVIVAAIALVAAARLAQEGGNPLDWYLARGRDEHSSPAQRKRGSAR